MRFKRILPLLLSATMITTVTPINSADETNLLAFPGAEGGGKYTTGARGVSGPSVYHVTNLNDSGEGSLRDALSKSGRIVVFDVGGVITLGSQLSMKDDITILGQTAPGDGITITGNDVSLENTDNIIMRYLRVRPSDNSGGEPDGLGGRWAHNIIIDHCSVSWSVDETMTLYAGSIETNLDVSSNLTVQNCLVSESMRMSNHIKGAHGYGGIIGGTNASYHHNLFAHHDSRSPRFDRNLKSTDFANNVIYDWGNTNSMYGAEPYSYSAVSEYLTSENVSHVNIRNNYIKYGPSTKPSIRARIFDVTNSGKYSYDDEVLKSDFYISGNYVDGSDSVTSSNVKGVNNSANANFLSEPVDMGEYDIDIQTAEDAYADVLSDCGATLPKRDALDARVVADVINGTGRIINTDEEIGSLTSIESSECVFEIPDEWKEANDMGSASETDIAPSGYTWIEEYANYLTEEGGTPTNPDITVDYPSVASRDTTYDKTDGKGSWLVTDEAVSYSATAAAKDGTTVVKMELWDGTKLLSWYDDESSVADEIALAPGVHYLRCRAYNDKGEKTDSPVANVYVTSSSGLNVAEIGSAPFSGKSAAWQDGDTTYIAGSGLIKDTADICAYNYYPVSGDFEYIVKIADIPKYENGVLAGIMYRETLDANSRMAMVSDTWYKYGENIIVPVRSETGGSVSYNWMKDSSGNEISNTSSYDSSSYPLPKYMKLERSGETLTISVSANGTSWTNNSRQPYTIDVSDWSENAYIGLACDSANGYALNYGSTFGAAPVQPWYTIAGFSDVCGTNVDGVPTPAPTPEPSVYDDPNTLPTTKPMTESMTLSVADDSDLPESGSRQVTETVTLLDGYMRLYATSSKDCFVENYTTEYEGTDYTWRIRMGGGGKLADGVPQYRVTEVMPAYDGKLKLYVTNNGSGTRTMDVMQCGEVIGSVETGGGGSVLEVDVIGGQRVYIYPEKNSVCLHAVIYTPDEQPEEPCVKLTAVYNEDKTLKYVNIEDSTTADTEEPTDELTRIFRWYDLVNMVPVK